MEQENKYSHEEKVFDLLENWKSADVPDYLETRIMAQIEYVRPVKSLKWGWATLAIVLAVNTFAATRYVKQSKPESEEIYREYLQTNPDLELYYSSNS